MLIIWGGSDIHPSFYNRPKDGTYCPTTPSQRDQEEAKLFTKAVDAGMLILGVCRGAQLGCALSGGILVQDVSGHTSGHHMTTSDGRSMVTSSLHHQMMYPWGIEHTLLAWSKRPYSSHYQGLSEKELETWPRKAYEIDHKEAFEDVIEPEVVYFPKNRCLAVQGHPEMMDPKCAFNVYLKEQLDRLLFPS